MRALLVGLLLALLAAPAFAADAGVPASFAGAVKALRTERPVIVDGLLDEEVWKNGNAIGEFTQRDPDQGVPPRQKTEVRVAFDDDALYVGARMFDTAPDSVTARVARRDNSANSDMFTILLDPLHDKRTGYYFAVTAGGVLLDGVLMNDEWDDDSWDGVWLGRAKRDGQGWTAEMRIPFSQLRFTADEHHTFGINATRYIQRKNERDWLVHVPKTESGLASRMGHLEGLNGVSPHRTLELLPYLSSRAEYVAPPASGDPFNDGTRLFGSGGLDLKYRPTSSLTLDGTINPDFGQVEVDPAVVNLTAFETFFEEKRPFFIEGANIFSNFGRSGSNSFWGFNRSEPLIFYSRRIGRSPQGSADGDFVDRPSATTILGAAKITGKTRNGWSVGLLEAVTGRERAQTVTDGFLSRTEVEPLSNYLVGRVQREKGRGAFGLITTAVNRDLRTPALRADLPDQAYVAGVDAHYFLDSKRDWVVTGQLTGSHVAGSTDAVLELQRAPQRYYQRPDAPHLELDPAATNLRGWTGSVNLNRNSGVHGVNAALWGVSPGFESSDAGFNFNGDRGGMHAVYQWHNPNVNRFSRRRSLGIAKWYTWNFARELQGDGVHLFGNMQFKNYWSVFASGGFFRAVQDDRATRGGPSMLAPRSQFGFFALESDSRKRISAGVNWNSDGNEFGGSSMGAGINVTYRPAASLEISSGPSFQRNHNLAQYVDTFVDAAAAETFGSRYVFATLHQKEFSLQTRVNYIVSPKMSLQIYLQPLVSVGDYDVFKELARPRTYDFVRYGVDRGALTYDPVSRQYTVVPGDGGVPFTFGDPDFNFKSLRLNAIFRWEWRPGSAMYFVWTEQREDDARPGRFALRRDVGGVFAAPADDIILFKIAYWFQR